MESLAGSLEEKQRTATVTAAALNQFMAAGKTAGLAHLEVLLVKGPHGTTVAGVHSNAFVLVTVDPTNATTDIENVVRSWTPQQQPPALPVRPKPTPPSVTPPPLRTSAAPAEASQEPLEQPAATLTPPTPNPTAAESSIKVAGSPWADLRRALVRGQLTEASSHQRDLIGTAGATPARVGCEPLDANECERAMRVLLEGIGSVLAGDGIGGCRTLSELTLTSQRNLSLRWVAHHWSTWATLKSGTLAAARAHAKEALAISRQLDMEAQAVSQWTAAEVLTHARDATRAIAWLNEARIRFTRLGDNWGLSRTWLVEARIMALTERGPESDSAARKAWEINPSWDEPPTFLARQALMRNDLTAAEEILSSVQTQAADRVRGLIDAIRQEKVSPADAAIFLKEQDAPPNVDAIKTLERIANAAPAFLQAREALAWMLLKIGRYSDAATLFRGLLSSQLAPSDRASVMLGLGCIANAQQVGNVPEKRLIAVVNADRTTTPDPEAPLPALSSSVLSTNGVGTNAVFSGQLSGFALPDLLEFLRGARRTGLLVCSSAAGIAALRFRDGWITGAAAPGTPDIGQLLVEAGKLSAPTLRSVAARQGSEPPDHLIGELLVRDGLVDVAAVQEALTKQIETTIRELVKWVDGQFAFNRDEDEQAGSELSVSIDPQGVLLNVFREMDEASRSAS